MQNKTGQEVYAAFRQAIEQGSSEAQKLYSHLPAKWEDLSQEDQANFQQMSWKMNLIASEFSTEE